MVIFEQESGFISLDDVRIGVGYSGNGQDLNNTLSQSIRMHGPIPQGLYTIGEWYDDPAKGPCVAHLIPDPTNVMFGRSGFMIHGDNKFHNHSASDGCIEMGLLQRLAIKNSGQKQLLVKA